MSYSAQHDLTFTANVTAWDATEEQEMELEKAPLFLPGVFSVSATKKVQFSKGNLWADGSNALHFEANQYSSASSWDASHISHFTWSSTVETAVGFSFSGDYLFCNESNKVSVDGSGAICYALSSDEWTYLFNTRTVNGSTGKDKSYSLNIIYSGIKGLVLYPDNYTGAPISGTVESLPEGVVFLPAAGYRSGYNINGVGDNGDYWSSTADDSSFSYEVYFSSSGVSLGGSEARDFCHSVRLITESN